MNGFTLPKERRDEFRVVGKVHAAAALALAARDLPPTQPTPLTPLTIQWIKFI